MPRVSSSIELLELGLFQYRNKNYGAAINSLTMAFQSTQAPPLPLSDMVTLLHKRSAANDRLGDLKAALEDALSIVKLQKHDATGYLRAYKLLMKLNKPKAALALCQRGIRDVPTHSQVFAKMRDELQRSLTASAAMDFISVLPLELVEAVLGYLTFKDVVICTRVSKGWKSVLTSMPALWRDLDLSAASKHVKDTFWQNAVKRSRGQLHSATLQRLFNPEKVIHSLTRKCPNLQSLFIMDGGLQSDSLSSDLCMTRRLTTLRLGTRAVILIEKVSHILQQCPGLRVLECYSVECKLSASEVWKAGHNSALETLTLVASNTSYKPLINMSSLIKAVPNLRRLALRGWSDREGATLWSFSQLANLEYLDLRYSDEHLARTVANEYLPRSLRTLILNATSTTSESTAYHPDGSMLPRLEMLDCPGGMKRLNALLSHPKYLETYPDNCEAHQQKEWSSLHTLNIPSMPYGSCVTASDLAHPRLQSLRRLAIRNCPLLGDEIAAVIATNFRELQTLDLSATSITGVGVKSIVSALKGTLHSFHISFCEKVSPDAIEWAQAEGVRVVRNLVADSGSKATGRKVRH